MLCLGTMFSIVSKCKGKGKEATQTNIVKEFMRSVFSDFDAKDYTISNLACGKKNPSPEYMEKFEKLMKDDYQGVVEDIEDNLIRLLNDNEANAYVYEVMKVFLLGAISRVYYPGIKFEYMLCLVGGQGAGKSTFIRFLASRDSWFCDDIKRLDDEKVYEHLAGHWIIEIAEMLALNNAKCNEATKAFLSRQYDNYRTPFMTRAEDRPRQCVFAGTSNMANFLPCDRSGNRRFLPVWCDAQKAEVHILENETESRAYIAQLWAEAMVIFRSGKYSLRLPREIEKDLAKYQAPFTQEDTWADLIRSFLEDYSGKIVCCQMLYREALDMYGLPSKIENSQIMEIMSHIPGWRRFQNPRHFEKYKRQKGWERVTTSSDNQGSESNFVDATDIDNPFVTKEI